MLIELPKIFQNVETEYLQETITFQLDVVDVDISTYVFC